MGARLIVRGVPVDLAIIFVNTCYFPPGKRMKVAEACIVGCPEALARVTQLERLLIADGSKQGALSATGEEHVITTACQLFGPEMGVQMTAAYLESLAQALEESARVLAAGRARDKRTTLISALRYVDPGLEHTEESFIVPAILFSEDGTELERWSGVLLSAPRHIAFLDERDLNANDTTDGTPIIIEESQFERCIFLLPAGFPEYDQRELVRFDRSTNGDIYMALTARGRGTAKIRFEYSNWDTDMQMSALGNLGVLIARVCRGLDREVIAPTDEKPRIPVLDVNQLHGTQAFENAQEAMTLRYFQNGNNPRMLKPLLDQYLDPVVGRSPLRAYMTDGSVQGSWLVERYVDYAGSCVALLQLANYHFREGELEEDEHQTLKELFLRSATDMSALVVCAIQRAGRELPTSPDGSPYDLGDDFITYSKKLDEIVAAHDENDPVRLLQNLLHGPDPSTGQHPN